MMAMEQDQLSVLSVAPAGIPPSTTLDAAPAK